MHEILHILGICPDHFTHANMMDVAIILYSNPSLLFQSFWGVANFFKAVFK